MYLLFEIGRWIDRVCRPDALSRPATNREISRSRKARTGSARNWSSLADVGFAAIAGAAVMENHKVLCPDLPDGRRKRLDVDVQRYAPQCSGIQGRLDACTGHDIQSNTFELQGHRKNEIRQQHRHLERDELIQSQPVRPERLVAIPGTRLCTNQGRGGNKVRDIPVSRPNLPERRGPGAPVLRVGIHQGDGLADAWSASPRLVLSFDQVVMLMEYVCYPQPISLDPAKLVRKWRAARLQMPPANFEAYAARRHARLDRSDDTCIQAAVSLARATSRRSGSGGL